MSHTYAHADGRAVVLLQLTLSLSGEHLGAEPLLPYLSPELRGEKLLVGANFASAGVGILNDTGIQFVRGGCMLSYYYSSFHCMPCHSHSHRTHLSSSEF